MGKMQIPGRFVGNGLDRSVPFARYIALSVRLQRAAYMPPLRSTRNVVITANPRDAAVSFQCARAAGTPDLLFIIYYLLFLTRPPPACIQNPFYRTPSAPFSPGFVQSGQNAHFTPKNMCNILRKTPLRTGSFFGTIKLCKSAFLQVRPEQNLDVSAKRRGPVRVPRTDCKSL